MCSNHMFFWYFLIYKNLCTCNSNSYAIKTVHSRFQCFEWKKQIFLVSVIMMQQRILSHFECVCLNFFWNVLQKMCSILEFRNERKRMVLLVFCLSQILESLDTVATFKDVSMSGLLEDHWMHLYFVIFFCITSSYRLLSLSISSTFNTANKMTNIGILQQKRWFVCNKRIILVKKLLECRHFVWLE